MIYYIYSVKIFNLISTYKMPKREHQMYNPTLQFDIAAFNKPNKLKNKRNNRFN